MKLKFLSTILITILLTLSASAEDNQMNSDEIENFRQGLKNFLVRTLPKKCERLYVREISLEKTYSNANCEAEANDTFMVRFNSKGWVAQKTKDIDGTVKVELIENKQKQDVVSNSNQIESTRQEMIVKLNSSETKIVQIYLKTVVKVTGEKINVGTITNPRFEPTQDIYEDQMLATY